MVVWVVRYDWYSTHDDMTVGIFTNLALAAREAMKYTEYALEWCEVLGDKYEKPWGFYIDIVDKSDIDWWEFTGKIIFERVTVNDLS
jgi:hypothetical protein